MTPRVALASIPVELADGTFTIGREAFPQFASYARLGVHVQSDRMRVADPGPAYVETALAALAEACVELGVPEASVALVETVEPPPVFPPRYGFKGSYTTDYPTIVWICANWTPRAELRGTVRQRRLTSRSPAPTPPRSQLVIPDRRRTLPWHSRGPDEGPRYSSTRLRYPRSLVLPHDSRFRSSISHA